MTSKQKNEMIAWLIAGAIVVLLACSLIFKVQANGDHNNLNQCNRNNPENCPEPTQICGNGEHTGNPHCQPPETPSATPSATLTPEPTVETTLSTIPTVEPTVQPTTLPTTPPSPHGDGLSDGKSDGKSDSKSSPPQVTLIPCGANTCGWK